MRKLLLTSLGGVALALVALLWHPNLPSKTGESGSTNLLASANLPAASVPVERPSHADGSRPHTLISEPKIWQATVQQVLPGATPQTVWLETIPQKIAVAVLPDSPLEFVFTSVERGAGYVTWVAKSATIPGAVLVGTATANGIDLIQSVPGLNEYGIHVRGGNVVITEKNPDSETCGTGPLASLPPTLASSAAADSGAVALAATVYTSDVLFLYDAAALTKAANSALDHDGVTYIASTARNQIQLANVALANSGITNFQWRAAGFGQVPAYAATGKMADDLNQISGNSTDTGKFAHDQATSVGADQTVLWIGGASDWAGLAWVPGHESVVIWNSTYETLAHEMGHNLGCQHDRQTMTATDGDGKFCYGHRFTHNGKDCGDIMSYASYRYGYFSNPSITVDMSTVFPANYGVGGGSETLGVADNQPRAADCARTITEAAATMAAYRTPPAAPAITVQPVAQTTMEGNSLTLSVTATGSSVTYQWRKNGINIAGATSASYTIGAVSPSDSGNYDCLVSNGGGSVTTAKAVVTINAATGRAILAPPANGKLVNISARAHVGTDGDILIGGAIISGGRAQILVRAVGPTLGGMGVTGTLANPLLKAADLAGNPLTQNDDWGTNANAAQLPALFAKLGAFALPAGSKDAALLLTLDAGCYSFQVSGADSGTGVALLEIYIVTDSGLPGKLVNLSARAYVGTGGDVLIAGFITQGSTQVLVRGIGPQLGTYGVPGVLAAPSLGIYDSSSTLVDSVATWDTTFNAPQARALFSKLGAFSLATSSTDTIDVLTINGLRTAIIQGANSATGVALAEVYLVQP